MIYALALFSSLFFTSQAATFGPYEFMRGDEDLSMCMQMVERFAAGTTYDKDPCLMNLHNAPTTKKLKPLEKYHEKIGNEIAVGIAHALERMGRDVTELKQRIGEGFIKSRQGDTEGAYSDAHAILADIAVTKADPTFVRELIENVAAPIAFKRMHDNVVTMKVGPEKTTLCEEAERLLKFTGCGIPVEGYRQSPNFSKYKFPKNLATMAFLVGHAFTIELGNKLPMQAKPDTTPRFSNLETNDEYMKAIKRHYDNVVSECNLVKKQFGFGHELESPVSARSPFQSIVKLLNAYGTLFSASECFMLAQGTAYKLSNALNLKTELVQQNFPRTEWKYSKAK